MEGQQGSPVDPTTRNNHSRTPLIHVTLPNIPDDQTDDSPYSDARDDGLDNPAFHRGSIDVTPTLTPQPNLPQNSPMFVFDPECSSLYSRQGSASVYSRRGSSNLDVSNPRTPYAVSRRGSGQPSDKSSLTVPTIVTSKKLYFRYLLICAQSKLLGSYMQIFILFIYFYQIVNRSVWTLCYTSYSLFLAFIEIIVSHGDVFDSNIKIFW